MRDRHPSSAQTADRADRSPAATVDAGGPASRSVVPAWVFDAPPVETTQGAEFGVSTRPGNGLLTIPEVAAILRLSTRTIARLIRRGDLVTIRIGRSVRLHPDDLLRFLQTKSANIRGLAIRRE